jgi:hypothetical protein
MAHANLFKIENLTKPITMLDQIGSPQDAVINAMRNKEISGHM